MKSLFLLCEYGIPTSTVEILRKNNVTFDDILFNTNKLNQIFGESSIKKQQIIDKANKLSLNEKQFSIYELLEYGLSKGIVDKLFELNINITDINKEILLENKITGSTYQKVISAYKEWAKNTDYKIPLNITGLKKLIKTNMGHTTFEKEELERLINENGYDSQNFEEKFCSLKLPRKENKFYYPFDIYDLLQYGLSNTNLNFLVDNNISLEGINMELKKKYDIKPYKFGQIMQAYNEFSEANNYIPPINSKRLMDCLIKNFKFKEYTIDEVHKVLPNEEQESINSVIIELLQSGKVIKNKENNYFNVFPKLTEKLDEIENKNNHYDIVIKKLSGMTLEQIGQEYGLTRERIRQIFTKELNKIKDIDEERFADIFQKYNFDEDLFCNYFNENKQTYYYLKEKYQSGELEAYELLNEINITEEQSELIRKRYNLIVYNDENIVATKTSILVSILKASDNQVDYETIMLKYNNIIDENELKLDKLSLKDYRNVDSILNRNQCVLNTLGSSYRYYNCNDLDQDDYNELKKLFDIEPGVYSAELFFKDNPILMKRIDIRDEYELHNLFRKVLGIFNEKIVYARMPDVYIDCDDKVAFIDEKIQELSPITLDEFVEYIYQNYGHKVNTMKAYIVANFSNYINNRKDITYLITDCPIFTEDQYLLMKEYLKEDIYSNITIKKLLTEKFNVNDFKLLNNLNFDKLGYKVRGNYIMKNSITSLETYFREKVLNQDYYIIPNELKKIGSTFTNYLYRLIYEKLLFKLDDEKYITISKLNKMGIYESDVDEFINNIEKVIPENAYFNLHILNTDFESKLFNYDFPDCFFENIIMIINEVKVIKLKKNMLFIKTSETATREKFINSFIVKDKTYIYEIKEKIKHKYNIDLQESYIKEFINKNKYYLQSNTNCVYLNKEKYEEEINQWDILQYVD